MEINLKNFPKNQVWDDASILNSILPSDNSKQVTKNVLTMLSKFPLGSRNGFELGLGEELAEIRNTLKDLDPVLKTAQTRIQSKLMSFARSRNHTSISERGNEPDPKSRPFFKRLLNPILSAMLTISPFHNRFKKKKSEKQIRKEFQAFYVINGVDFKSAINHAMMRCDRLEKIMCMLKNQLHHPSQRNGNDGMAGIAFQLGRHREQMDRWSRHFDYGWLEVRSVRRMFIIMPTLHCWQAIFDIMTRQSN